MAIPGKPDVMTSIHVGTDSYTKDVLRDLSEAFEHALKTKPEWSRALQKDVIDGTVGTLGQRLDEVDCRIATLQARAYDAEQGFNGKLDGHTQKLVAAETLAQASRLSAEKVECQLTQTTAAVAKSAREISIAAGALREVPSKAELQEVKLSIEQKLAQSLGGILQQFQAEVRTISSQIVELRSSNRELTNLVGQLLEEHAALRIALDAQNGALAHIARPWYKKLFGA